MADPQTAAPRARLAPRDATSLPSAAVETRATRVAVVGAGPAGAALAFALAARGIEVTLLERQLDFAREFRGEAITPGGVRALRALDLGAELDAVPHQVPDRFALYRGRRPFLEVSIDSADFGAALPVLASQPHLLEAIVARAATHPGFVLLRGATVRELLHEGGRVTGVRARTDAGEVRVQADLVVGADGRASVVRRAAGFPCETRDAPMDVVWCKLPWPEAWGAQRPVRAHLGGGHLLISLPAPTGELQLAWVILKGTFGALRGRGVEEWVREMADYVAPDLADHLLAHRDRITRPFLLDVVVDRVRGWARPGVLLLGDAAHTMSPVGAQGINVALRDVVVAANHLVPALREGAKEAPLDAAASRVEPERAREIDTIQRLASLPPRVVMGRGRLAALARALIPVLVRSGLARGPGLRTARLFLDGVSDVELRV